MTPSIDIYVSLRAVCYRLRTAAPDMTKASVRERHRAIVETDWKMWAELYVQANYVDKGIDVSIGNDMVLIRVV